MKRVLILCKGISCRSQMAESLWRELGHGYLEACSTGSKPSSYVHPLAIRTMAEIRSDITSAASKSVGLRREQEFDIAVTDCDNAWDACPFFPYSRQKLHRPFAHLAEATGSDDGPMQVFRRFHVEIAANIKCFLASANSKAHWFGSLARDLISEFVLAHGLYLQSVIYKSVPLFESSSMLLYCPNSLA